VSDVFVSYSSQDRARVVPLVQALERRGWTVWWDRKIDAGTAFDREIEAAIDEAKCIVVVWSENSVQSDWVRSEASEGLNRGILAPVAIDPVRPPLAFRLTQTVDLTAADASLEPLIEAVRRHCPLANRTGRNQSPFTGRAVEFAHLEGLLRRARGGDGALVLLSGEAGVGKTRLVKEVEALARQGGMLALTGRCVLAEGAPPYQPLLEQIEQVGRLAPGPALRTALGENAPELAKLMPELRQQFPDIPMPIELPPDQERRYLLHGCGEFIDRAARVQPLLLIYEDLHWAGESTCRLLRRLAERLRESPVLMIGTYRDTDLDAGQPFAETMRELIRERLAEDIPLKRLGATDVAALLEGRAQQAPPPELVSLIFAETEGNPFFVEELYRHLDESQKLFAPDGYFRSGISIADTDVPRGIRLVIEHRLAKVSETCRRLLTAGAVAGRVISFDLLARIGDIADDALLNALEEAEDAALLEDVSVGREARYQFVHEQIRQTLLSALSLPRRQRLHLRVADALEQGAPAAAERNAGEIAFHLYQAGAAAQSDRTVRYLLTAAQRAVDAVAFEDALRLLDMAAEVTPPEDRAACGRVQLLRGLALRGAARIEDALAALAQGLALGDDVEGFASLLHQRAALLVDLYRGEEALGDLEHLLEIARAAGDQSLELEAQRLLAGAHYRLSLDQPEHVALAREASDRTIELARAANDQRALALALIHSSHFVDYWVEYRPIAKRNLAEAKTIAEGLKDESLLLDYASMTLRVFSDAPMEREARAEEILRGLEARRDPIRLKEHLFWMIGPTRNAGRLERSVEVADRAIELAARLDVPPVQYPTFKAQALIALGRFDEAWESLGHEVTHGGYRFGAALQHWGYFLFRCQVGALRAALADAEGMIADCRAVHRVWMLESAVDFLVTAAARAGLHREALDVLAAADVDHAPRGLAAAFLTLADGDPAGALAEAQRIQGVLMARCLPLLAADAGQLAVDCLLQLTRWDEARQEADRQIAFCETSGYRNLHWRLLAARADAHAGLGDPAGADRDRAAAASLLDALAATMPNAELRDAFLSQPAAAQLHAAAERA
jgi:tetratricopeptide (TPR) repeat protein